MAIAGNGRLLAGFDGSGTLTTLTAPHLDYPQHIRLSRLGLTQPGRTAPGQWLDAAGWKHDQDYLLGTNILCTRSLHSVSKLKIEQRAAAIEDMLLIGFRFDSVSLEGMTLVWELGLQLGGQPLANTIVYVPDSAIVTAYHREHALGIAARPAIDRVRVRSGASSGWGESGGGRIAAVGEVTAQCFVPVPLDRLILVVIAVGLSAPNVPPPLGEGQGGGCGRLGRSADWPAELQPRSVQRVARPGALEAEASDCYERSLLTITQLADRSGALIAGPPVDARFEHSGGYAYCWPRDGGYIAHALDIAGPHGAAHAFFEWVLAVQPRDGIWKQRYYADGALAPCWAEHQLDETGTVLWALDQHLRINPDPVLLRAGVEAARKAYREIERMAAADGWPPVTQNLWEDQDAVHLYTLAALLAASRAWLGHARSLGDAGATAVLELAESKLQQALSDWPVEPRTGALARALLPSKGTSHRLPDFTADASLLGLSVPFGVLDVDDPRLQATVASIERDLATPAGRVRRFRSDRYRGGNPWPLCSLWLAWHYVRAGARSTAMRLYRQVLADRTSAGLLPEQVDARTGRALWVVPLPWAHAWFVLVSNAILAMP